MSTPESVPTPTEMLEAAAAAEEAGTPAEAAPAEERLYAGKYQTPEQLEHAYQEAQTAMHAANQARSQAEQRARDLESAYTQTQQPQMPDYGPAQLPDGTPILTPQQLEDLAMESPLQAADLMARYRTFEARAQLEAELAPLRQQVSLQSANTAVDQLRQVVGEELFERNKEALATAIERDRSSFDVDAATRLERFKQAIYAAEYARTQERPRDDTGRFIASPNTESGSSAMPDQTPATPVDEFDQQMQALRNYEVPRDAFGKRLDPNLL